MVCLAPGKFATEAESGPAGPARAARAELLLSRPPRARPDRLAARALQALGPVAGDPRTARQPHPDMLTLRFAGGFLGLAIRPFPLGAAHFHRAIAPFTPPGERAEMLRLIARHEAHLSLRLSLGPRSASDRDASATTPLPRLLLAVIAAIAPDLALQGLLWRPTGMLHTGQALAPLHAGQTPEELLVAPRPASIGPRRLPALELAGVADLLGYRLQLHLLDIDFATARATALAFLQLACRDPGLRARQSFSHGGRNYRIAHHGSGPDLTLIPTAGAPPPPAPPGRQNIAHSPAVFSAALSRQPEPISSSASPPVRQSSRIPLTCP